MSKTLLLFVTLYFGGLILALLHPIYPLVSYLVFYYMPPQTNWWGNSLPDLRYSLLAAAALLGSILINSSGLERQKDERNPALPWLLFFGLNTIVVTIWALDRARSWFWTVSVLKLILLYVLIPVTIRTPAHFDTFSAVHIAGATYWGYKAWEDPERQMGRLKNVGGPDSQNENEAAGHLLTVIPFVAVYALSVKRRALQGLIAVCGAFIINVFILCNSRGATLGLLMMGCAAILFAGKGRRVKLIGVTAGALLGLFVLADHRFIERQQTTIEHKDASAQGRLESWKAGVEVIRDYPMGGGGRAFHILSPRYIPGIVERHDGEERSVHSTYLQLGAEWGVQGMILWMGFLTVTMLMLWKARARAKGEPWFFYRFMAIELSLIGTLVYAVFGNRLYGESLYWMCALAVALQRMRATAAAGESAVVRQPAADVPLNTQPAIGNI